MDCCVHWNGRNSTGFFFVLHNFPWWSVPTHSRVNLMRWDSLVTYDLKFCMTNRPLNTSNFVLLKGCELLACGCVKYSVTGNLADRLLYLVSEICMVTSRNLHVIILQIPEIHYAKYECYSQSSLFPSCTCYGWLNFTNCCVMHLCLWSLPPRCGKLTSEMCCHWCQPSPLYHRRDFVQYLLLQMLIQLISLPMYNRVG